jgi:hypothetical protein
MKREELKQIIKEVIGSIYWPAENFDPNDPDVHLHGFGVWKLSSIKSGLVDRLKKVVEYAESGNWDAVQHLLSDKAVIKHMLQGLEDTENQMKQSQVKRKLTIMKKNKENL